MIVETGRLEAGDFNPLLESLLKYPNQRFRVNVWAVEKNGWVRIESGRVTASSFEGRTSSEALACIQSEEQLLYRVTLGE